MNNYNRDVEWVFFYLGSYSKIDWERKLLILPKNKEKILWLMEKDQVDLPLLQF